MSEHKPTPSPTPHNQPKESTTGTEPKIDLGPKPILFWHERLKTKRDLLCLAVVNEGWNYLQEPNTTTENEVTEAEYLAAYERAKKVFEGCQKAAARPSAACLLAHPSALIGVVVSKPSRQESDHIMGLLSDNDLDRKQTSEQLAADFVGRLLWPKEGSEGFRYLMEEAPAAIENVFPEMVIEIMGTHKMLSKKRG